MGKHSIHAKRRYKRKKRERNRQKKKQLTINHYCTCARSSCCFAPSSSSESKNQFLNTVSFTDTCTCSSAIDSSSCFVSSKVEKDKDSQGTEADVNKKVEKPSKKSSNRTSVDYYNDPLYIRFKEYNLLKKRTQQIESQNFW